MSEVTERYPNKAGILTLMSEVNAWRTRLNKGETKLPTDEFKSVGVWLTNLLQHVAELRLDTNEVIEELASDAPEGISEETAQGFIRTIMTLVEHAGGMEMLPAEIKLQVAETLGVIKDLQGEEVPASE